MNCHGYEYNAAEEQPRQQRDWDCSAAATAWLGRSIGWVWQELDVAYSFQQHGIATPQLGLLDGTGVGIVRWLSLQPLASVNRRIEWSSLVDHDWSCPLIMGSTGWYHWTGVRGIDEDGNLQLANSAPGWGDIWQSMTPQQFNYFNDFWAVLLTGG